jgi:putative flippase GtrA
MERRLLGTALYFEVQPFQMRIIRYFFVGSVAALIDITIFFLFAKLAGFNYLIVGAIGFILATLVNYILSIRHVFESQVRFSRNKEVLFVYIISLFGFIMNQLVLYTCIDLARVEMMLSKIIATATVFFFNFYARKNFVFKVLN